LLPGLPLEGLPLGPDQLGPDPLGPDPLGGGVLGGGPDAEGGGEPESGGGAEEPDGDAPHAGWLTGRARCRWLFAAPWALAATEGRLVTTPEFADHLDRERGVRLRQALGGFAGDGAARALDRIRRTAADCPRFRTGARGLSGGRGGERDGGHDGRHGGRHGGWRGGRAVTVTVTPGPDAFPAGDGAAPDEAYAARMEATSADGRSWTGYLAVDRVGGVLSVLWHLGPRDVIDAAEAASTRRAAVAKARPLAARLGD
jgi:hypothetical protein